MRRGQRSSISRHLRPGVGAVLGLSVLLGSGWGAAEALGRLAPQRYVRHGMWNLVAPVLGVETARAGGLALVAGLLVCAALWRPLGRLRHRAWTAIGVVGASAALAVVLLNAYAALHRRQAFLRGPNVVLIGVDTLRADHLGLYGYHRDTSPNLDAWAAGATVYDNCIASTPRTTQSLASILTGKYPYRTGVRYLSDTLPDAQLSLAEVLQNAGYRTAAVVATGIPHKRLDQGFDIVIDTDKEWAAEEAVDRAIAALDGISGRYFLFVFLRDPHMPYRAPRLMFDRQYRGPFYRKIHYRGDKAATVFRNDFGGRLRRHAVALYDSEVHYADREIGRLLAAVEARSRDNVVAFFADHGESLGEHDYYYDHGDLLYQPGLRIPCILAGGPFGAERIAEVVRSVDLMPTLLAGLGIGIRDAGLDGVDLRSDHPPLEAYSETGRALLATAFETGRRHLPGLEGRLRSLVYGRTKVIYVPGPGGEIDFEVYDLEADPGELSDLAAVTDVARLRQRLRAWVERDRPNWAKPEGSLTPAEVERLRRLGYL
jgi:arylsulfatase A-like enzyme